MDNFLSYFLTWTNGIVGQMHLAFALVALIAGASVIVLRKGTGLHAGLGWLYLISMVILNGTALLKYDLTGSPNMFHAFAVGSLMTVIAAYVSIWVYIRTKKATALQAHGTFMIWSYFGLVMALIAETVTRAFPFMLHGDGGWFRFTTALTVFSLIAAFFTHRFIRREISKTLSR